MLARLEALETDLRRELNRREQAMLTGAPAEAAGAFPAGRASRLCGADSMALFLALIYGTTKPLNSQRRAAVSKNLISGTARPELDALTAKHLSH